jgi:hypothetical protein
MTHVYLVWHVRSGGDAKLVGVYSTETSAQSAIERKKDQPGFVDHPDGFEIARYEVDRDAWSEGFVSA